MARREGVGYTIRQGGVRADKIAGAFRLVPFSPPGVAINSQFTPRTASPQKHSTIITSSLHGVVF